MTNTERIQANNAELQKCIDKANTLPEAGVDVELYEGEYSVTPKVVAQTLPTAQRRLTEDISVKQYLTMRYQMPKTAQP